MYEMKVTEDQVMIKNGTGAWMSPVVHGAKLYPSQKALAEKFEARGAQVSLALTNDHNFHGKKVRKATESEVRAKLKVKEDQTFAYRVVDGSVEVKGSNGKWTRAVIYKEYFYDNANSLAGISKSRAYAILAKGGDDKLRYAEKSDVPDEGVEVHTASPKKSKKKKQDKAKESTFVGVQWPDGSVEVRLGSSFTMARASKKELPSEIIEATTWLA